MDRSSASEAEATRALYERYAGQIFGYCLHQLGSREEAEDAAQTTFMNAFRGLRRGIVPEVESAWLFKIAHNVCLSRRRSSWRRGRVEAPNDLEVLQEVVPARERIQDDLIGLQEALDQMPETQRRAILLREWQGLSYREIAGELELSQGAVETLIFRARRTLADRLEQPPRAGTAVRRARRGADAGAVLLWLKALFGGGGGAVKVAAAVVAVATTTAVAKAPFDHARPAPKRPAPVMVSPVKAKAAVTAPTRTSAPRRPAVTAAAVTLPRHRGSHAPAPTHERRAARPLPVRPKAPPARAQRPTAPLSAPAAPVEDSVPVAEDHGPAAPAAAPDRGRDGDHASRGKNDSGKNDSGRRNAVDVHGAKKPAVEHQGRSPKRSDNGKRRREREPTAAVASPGNHGRERGRDRSQKKKDDGKHGEAAPAAPGAPAPATPPASPAPEDASNADATTVGGSADSGGEGHAGGTGGGQGQGHRADEPPD